MTERTVAVLIALLSPAVARAESTTDVARADALFNAAKQLRDAGQYADACPQFAESSRLAPGVGVSLYLADCYERIGRTAGAWTAFRNAEKLALERNDKRADVAHARAQALEPKLSGLTILVPPEVAHAAPDVGLDGSQIIPAQQWNVAMAVDPGDHVVTVNLPSQPQRTLTAHVAAGSRTATVRVEGGAVPTPSETAPPVVTAAPAEVGDAGATRRWIGIGLLGAGAVGIGLGTVFLLNKSQSTSNAPSCTPPPNDTAATTASTIAIVAGGIALVAGLGLTISTPGPKGVGMVATPVLLAGGGGAQIRASF